jgi:uncharacterized membrane protein YfcA
MDWESGVRTCNIALSAVCIIALLYKAFKHWPRYQARTRDFWWVLFSWTLVVFLGTIEVLLDWGTSLRLFFVVFALLLTLKVTLRPNEVDRPVVTKEF